MSMSYIEDLPKKKKIQDFFADGDPEAIPRRQSLLNTRRGFP